MNYIKFVYIQEAMEQKHTIRFILLSKNFNTLKIIYSYLDTYIIYLEISTYAMIRQLFTSILTKKSKTSLNY